MSDSPTMNGRNPDDQIALHQDAEAISIAADARKQWNDARQAEVKQAKLLETDEVQDRMASEIFDAVMAHLTTVPRSISERVIEKFHAVNLPKKMVAG